ncbi:hypothetical protein BS78_K259400 [Paspalum vaginatum]|uniref:non-specific serine/threonine protein kinase n=1 Tax=Paspalum vaginatum TaxID=158149 RepID=A0A9W8CGK0_9POAL|nr:hypothetical protein BS78_K259400 [Paspalum vaginatum]
MALWNGGGQVASIAQLAGVDAYGLISMIVEAAQTVKKNKETCQLLARRAKMIGDLVLQLQSMQLMQNPETRIPVEQLEETLRHAYLLITSCQEGSYLNNCFMGGKHSEQLREVQNEITFYLQLFPLVSFVDTTRNLERLLNRDHPACSAGTTELHTIHHSELESRVRTEALMATTLEDPGTLSSSRSEVELEKTASQVNLIAGQVAFPHLSFSQILDATDQFSCQNLVGEGGFGYVYKGQLPNGLDVAVKRYRSSGLQSQGEFFAEIEAISNLRHKNVIVLHGICVQGEEKILVYEYMPKKCLASIISDNGERCLLNWPKRLQIIQGIADGLAYLHGHPQCIVHRDMKPSNILLDHEMNPKITDFGLSVRLIQSMLIEVDLPVRGTIGYAAPEYIATGHISKKQDVYGFGIVVLEIIGGKLCNSYIRIGEDTSQAQALLPEYARKYQKNPRKLVDPILLAEEQGMAHIIQCVKVALSCHYKTTSHVETLEAIYVVPRLLETYRVIFQYAVEVPLQSASL